MSLIVPDKEKRRIAFLKKQGAKPETIAAQAPVTQQSQACIVANHAAFIRRRIRTKQPMYYGVFRITDARSQHSILEVKINGSWMAMSAAHVASFNPRLP